MWPVCTSNISQSQSAWLPQQPRNYAKPSNFECLYCYRKRLIYIQEWNYILRRNQRQSKHIFQYIIPRQPVQWPRGLRPRSAVARLLRLWDVCLLWVVCVVRYRSLWWISFSSIGVLLTVVRRCVWFRNLVNEKAMTHWGLRAKNKKFPVKTTYQRHKIMHQQRYELWKIKSTKELGIDNICWEMKCLRGRTCIFQT